jgi:hypothetical protein
MGGNCNVNKDALWKRKRSCDDDEFRKRKQLNLIQFENELDIANLRSNVLKLIQSNEMKRITAAT